MTVDDVPNDFLMDQALWRLPPESRVQAGDTVTFAP